MLRSDCTLKEESMSKKKELDLTYKRAGVDYEPLDTFKRAAQLVAAKTRYVAVDAKEETWSRGESAFNFSIQTPYVPVRLSQVEEGLGTKNLVADAVEKLTGKTYYDAIGQDTVAMMVNDIITGGNLPLSIAMHLAVGDSEWFMNTKRWQALLKGWRRACEISGCLWGGGETPVLPGIIYPHASILSGSCVGLHFACLDTLQDGPQAGDSIILLGSSGIHANGLSLARRIADKLPDGYMTPTIEGCAYGETLLTPTRLYVPFVRACVDSGIEVHYMVNITGHGWRKLMRFPKPFHYSITSIPKPHAVFDLIRKYGPVTLEEMYGTFNMGAGFGVFVGEKSVKSVLDCARMCKMDALVAGKVLESTDGRKKVRITPLGLTFKEESLQIRR